MLIRAKSIAVASILSIGLLFSIGCNSSDGHNAPQAVKATQQSTINVQSLGAKGDGQTDDTLSIQRAVDQAATTGGTVFIPDGIYRIDALESIHMRDNVTMELASGAVLKAIPNEAPGYAVVSIDNAAHVRISGGKIMGERQEHFGNTGEWGMGVRIIGAKDVNITGLTVNDCWGDGFYIGASSQQAYSEDIQLIDVHADNNRRQGISLISGRNINIVRPVLTNTNGIPPAAGMDIEPNSNDQLLENVVVSDAVTANNTEGIALSLGELRGSGNPVSISIMNHKDEGSIRGMHISGGGSVIPGTLSIQKPQWTASQQNGLLVRYHPYGAFRIEVIQPVITDANASGQRDPVTGSGIVIYPRVGGVLIVNPTIRDTRDQPQMVCGIYMWDKAGTKITDVSIIDPLAIEGATAAKINIQSARSSDVIIEDRYGKL